MSARVCVCLRLINSIKSIGVVPDGLRQPVRIFFADFGQLQQDGFDKGGFVAARMVFFGSGCQPGRIGLHQHPVRRNSGDHFTQVRSPRLQGQDTGNPDVQAQIKIMLQFR